MSVNQSERVSRRGFLAAVGSAGLAMFAMQAEALRAMDSAGAAEALSFSAMRDAVGSTFMLDSGEGLVKLNLDRVTEESKNETLQHFSAHFSVISNSENVLAQQTYKLKNNKLGELELLLLPANHGATTEMTAVFCHLIKA